MLEVLAFMNPYFSHSHVSALQAERQRRLAERRPGSLWTGFGYLVQRIKGAIRAGGDSLIEAVPTARAEPCIDFP